MVNELLLIVIGLLLVAVVLLVMLILRRPADLATPLASLAHLGERTERELRGAIERAAQGNRSELQGTLGAFQQSLATQVTSVATVQNNQLDSFAQSLVALTQKNEQQLEALRADARHGREESSATLQRFGAQQQAQLQALTESNEKKLADVRATLETKLKELQADNSAKLEEMRKTVDEKLHATLEQRLGESFKLVSDRLEAVHKGLGEMQSLATGVGDLKRVLTNVKTRGTWGEVQLGALLEQMLTPDQYAKNLAPRPSSRDMVEFAVRLPGRGDAAGNNTPVWLPIDSKFPIEDYERILAAQDAADATALEEATKRLEAVIKTEAQKIRDKYVEPPHTTDFAILFLPTEGLYAEVLRRPGLSDWVQRECRVTVAGPTTLAALLNSLQLGFKTLAIEQRSSEVWQLLGAVKGEFGKFGEVLARTKAQLETVTKSIDSAEVRTRAMARKLRDVEQLDSHHAAQTGALLDLGDGLEK